LTGALRVFGCRRDGGHPGIAGSPRGRVMTEIDVDAVILALEAAIVRAQAT
jgi:hypothetical protein